MNTSSLSLETAEMPSAPLVLVIEHEGVATIKLNRPERLNALDHALGHALVEALIHVRVQRSVRAVVLTGTGSSFCAGIDLNTLLAARENKLTPEFSVMLQLGKQIVLAIADMAKPVIAAVNGPASGAGVGLALAADLRLASDRASFTQDSSKIGVFPEFGSTYFLPRLMGSAQAAEFLFAGETITTADAAKLGIVSRVVAHDLLAEEAYLTASRLATAAPLVAHGIKQALFTDHRVALERALDKEIRWQSHCFYSEDAREGIESRLEKRPPCFRGS